MAGRRLTRQEIKHDEFLDVLTRASLAIEENWKRYAAIAVGAIAVIVVAFGAVTWIVQSRARSSERLAAAQAMLVPSGEDDGVAYPVDAPGIEAALGAFEPLVEERGRTGRLASYYRGVLLLRLSRADEAESAFENALAGAEDPMLRGLVRQGLAKAADVRGDLSTAESRLKEMVETPEAGFPMDLVLYDLAMVQKRAGNMAEARSTVQRLALEHADSPLVAPAREAVPVEG